jgi:hypothetical protein
MPVGWFIFWGALRTLPQRVYSLASFQNFMSAKTHRASAEKRGGGVELIRLDWTFAKSHRFEYSKIIKGSVRSLICLMPDYIYKAEPLLPTFQQKRAPSGNEVKQVFDEILA